ncbi:uncharacterized protein [Drosophila kikkawai]|uniref:Uncharacterized protein n=1 Tax=Drosophila kikkawai TaxID=30033 RepID=A0A6P4HXU1_DROKI
MFSILLLSTFLRLVAAPEVEPSQVLSELNLILRSELNVFVDFEDFSSFLNLNLDTPRIQLSSREPFNLRIRGNFTEQALIIVQLTDIVLDNEVSKLLSCLLNELHELHIVFLSREDPELFQKQLYIKCYSMGFVNVLLVHLQDLYSFLPYPSIQPIKLSNISDYINRGRVLRNFQGFPVRVLNSTGRPRDFVYFNERNELVRQGYLFTAIKEFIDRYNATLVTVPQLEGEPYQVYQDIFARLRNKEIDVACHMKDRDWDVQSTEPLAILAQYFIVPHSRSISSYLYYSRPFRWSLWLVIVLTVVYGALMLHLATGRQRNEFGECLLHSLSHILYTGNRNINREDWRDVVIHVILMLAGFILTNIYLAMLSSILTSGLNEAQYHTLQDLAKAPYISIHDELYHRQLLETPFIPEALRRNSMTMDNLTMLIAYRDGLNRNYMYMLYEDRLDLILMQQYLLKTPLFDLVRQGVGFTMENYCVGNDLPYRGMISEFMRRVMEHGINIKLKADAFSVMIKCGFFTLMRDDEPPAKAFELEFYYFAFALWAVGHLLSLAVFVMEILKSK